MNAAATATYAFSAPGTISFDESLTAPAAYAVTYAAGKVTSATAGDVTTYTAAALAVVNVTVSGGANATAAWTVNGAAVSAPATLTEGDTYEVTYTADQGYEFASGAVTSASGTAGTEDITIVIADAAAVQQAGWVDDSSTVSNQTAAAAYPALDGTVLANADAQKLTDWAKANSVDFSAATAAPASYADAFMLNCAPTAEAVAAAEEAFTLTITFDGEGNPVVTAPEGYNVKPQLQGKASLSDSAWTPVNAASTAYKFYRCVLAL